MLYVPTTTQIPAVLFQQQGIDIALALLRAHAPTCEGAGYIFTESQLRWLLDIEQLYRDNSVVFQDTGEGGRAILDGVRLILTQEALANWRTNLEQLDLGDEDRTAYEERFQKALELASPVVASDAIQYPYAILRSTSQVVSARMLGAGVHALIVSEGEAVTDAEDAAVLFTSMMHHDGIGEFLWTVNGRTLSFQEWTPEDEAKINTELFYVLVPESGEGVSPGVSCMGLTCYNPYELHLYDDLVLRDLASSLDSVKVFTVGSTGGIVLPFGWQDDWTLESSRKLLRSITDTILLAYEDVYPVYHEEEGTRAIALMASSCLGPRCKELASRVEDERANVMSMQQRIEASEASIVDASKVLDRLQSVDPIKQAEDQVAILRSLEPIDKVLVSQGGSILRVITKPIIFRTKNFEWCFGRYQITIGDSNHPGFRKSDMVIPMVIENLDYPGKPPHPHSSAEFDWCWASVFHQLLDVSAQGDIASLVCLVLAFVQHLNWVDSYAKQLYWFRHRPVDSKTGVPIREEFSHAFFSDGNEEPVCREIVETVEWLGLDDATITDAHERWGEYRNEDEEDEDYEEEEEEEERV